MRATPPCVAGRIIHLIKVGQYLDTVPRRYLFTGIRKRAAMTVGVGLWCDDGLVLCTDSQITVGGGLKYPAPKIHNMSYGDWSVSLAFAGSPPLMELVQEKLYPKLLNPENDYADEWGEVVREKLEAILQEVCKKHRKHSI